MQYTKAEVKEWFGCCEGTGPSKRIYAVGGECKELYLSNTSGIRVFAFDDRYSAGKPAVLLESPDGHVLTEIPVWIMAHPDWWYRKTNLFFCAIPRGGSHKVNGGGGFVHMAIPMLEYQIRRLIPQDVILFCARHFFAKKGTTCSTESSPKQPKRG